MGTVTPPYRGIQGTGKICQKLRRCAVYLRLSGLRLNQSRPIFEEGVNFQPITMLTGL